MIDVSEMSLADLVETEADTPLARSLRRLAHDVANPGEPIAGFNSAL
jgi:FXSXX-COOH protein